jgi:hypothetical protein
MRHFEHIEAAIDRAAASLPAIETAPADAGACWRPLEALLGPALIRQLMYMGDGNAPDGRVIRLYKHGMTRRYLNVADDLSTWTYRAGRDDDEGTYFPCDLASALQQCLYGAERFGAAPGVAYDAAFRANRDCALAAAGYRSVTAVPGHGVK